MPDETPNEKNDVLKQFQSKPGDLHSGKITFGCRHFSAKHNLQSAVIGLGKAYVRDDDGEWRLRDIRIEMNFVEATETGNQLLQFAQRAYDGENTKRAERENPLRKKDDPHA